MLGRPLSRHHVLFISICCGCGIAGRLIASKFCSFVNHAVDYRVSTANQG